MIKTGGHLKQAREAMGWSPGDLARALRFQENHGASRILEMEAGKRAISGPVTVAVEALMRGFFPAGFEPPPAAEALPHVRDGGASADRPYGLANARAE